MKKTLKKAVVILISVFSLYSCSKDSDDSSAIDTDEYYTDSSGKYVMQLGDDGYNIFQDGQPYLAPDITNRPLNSRGTSLTAGYNYRYTGLCIAMPYRPSFRDAVPFSSLPVQPTTPSKKTVSCNLKAIGGGYKVTPKPGFLGGSSYECYECLINAIESDEFFVAACNGSISIGGSLSLTPELESIKQTLSSVNFNPEETSQFVQAISSAGYTCTKR